MRLVGICGSPRHSGNSKWALNYVLKESARLFDVERIYVSEKKISFCDGCLACEENLPCHYNDDMMAINDCLLKADIILVSTPVYFDNVPGILKNLIDRTNPICNSMKGKKAIIITFGQADNISWENATQYLNTYFDILGISIIGRYSFGARDIHDAMKDNKIITKLNGIVLELERIAKNG